MEALPPAVLEAASDDELIRFGELWNRGEALRSLVLRLPNEAVLEAGLSARKSGLLDRWKLLESPGIDGCMPSGAISGLESWIREAEILVSYISTLRRTSTVNRGDGRVRSAPVTDPSRFPQVMDSMTESDFVSDLWCWPWPSRPAVPLEKSSRISKGTLVKLGVLAGIGTMAALVYFDEDEE
jgi:hypothetical protein